MAITVIWLGAIDAAPEIVKERSVVERESAIGTRLGAYLASKLIVLFGLVARADAALRRRAASPSGRSTSSLDAYATVFGLLLVTGFAAVEHGPARLVAGQRPRTRR